jgi:peptidoglycan/xylan/chitin deacetylase (PgdA/CDA1 family)
MQRASRRCYRCLTPICKPCQTRFMGHVFCGDRCRRLYWLSERLAGVRNLFVRAGLGLRRAERSVDRVAGGRAGKALAAAFLALLLYQSWSLHRAASEIDLLRGGEAIAPPVAAPAAPVAPSVPLEPALTKQGKDVLISGPAPGFAVALLLVDGVETQSVPVREGRFFFTLGAREQEGRSAQVSVFGDGVAAVFSRALPLHARGRSAALPPEGAVPVVTAPVVPAPVAAIPPPPVLPAHPPSPAPSAAPPRASPPPPADFARGPATGNRIALTFDGGSSDNAAAPILEVLAQRRLKGTFFLTGEFIRRYPDLTRRIVAEGHEVGNHSFDHRHLTTFERNRRQDTAPGITREVVQKELADNAALFRAVTGGEMVRLWRAPYGEQNEAIRRWAWETGWRHVGWTYDPRTRLSLDTLDWVSNEDSKLYRSSDQMVKKIFEFGDKTGLGLAGGIVLLHLGNERRTDPIFPLARLIDELAAKGFTPVPVSDLLGQEAVARAADEPKAGQ